MKRPAGHLRSMPILPNGNWRKALSPEQWRQSNNHLGDKVVSFDRKLNRLLR